MGNTNPPGVGGTADNSDVYLWNGTAYSRQWDATASGVPAAANIDGFSRVDATHFYVSFSGTVTLAGVGTVADEDVVYYNAGSWSMWFDGSADGVGGTVDLGAVSVVGNTLYFSTNNTAVPPGAGGTGHTADLYRWNGGTSYTRVFDSTAAGLPAAANVNGAVFVDATHFYLSFSNATTTVPGLGAVQDEDVVYNSGGSWSVFFDGTAHGLGTSDNLDLDAISFASGATPPPPPPPTSPLWFSTFGNTNPPGVAGAADDADVYNWSGSSYARVFDASANGLPAGANVDGFDRVDATHFYASFSAATTAVPGLGAVQDEDVVYYNAGVWSVFFDGTAHGLTSAAEDVDALSVAGSTVYFSTLGNTSPPGVAGAADDADVYSWNGSSYARVWDASANGLAAAANVDGYVRVDATHFYLSFSAATTTVPGLGAVQDEDVVYSNAGAWSVYFDGTGHGLGTGQPRRRRLRPRGDAVNARTSGSDAAFNRVEGVIRMTRFDRRRFLKLTGGAMAAGTAAWAGKVLLPERAAAAAGPPDLALGGTDGWIHLPPTPAIPPFHPDNLAPSPFTTYIFGFRNVTGLSTAQRLDQKNKAQHSAPLFWVNQFNPSSPVDFNVQLTNLGLALRPDLFDAHTLHWHGFRNAIPFFDGEPTGLCVGAGGRDFTYFYRPREPGTYMYHCHVEDVEHVHMGMTGLVFVRPLQDGQYIGGFTQVHLQRRQRLDRLRPRVRDVPLRGLGGGALADAHIQLPEWSDYRADFSLLNGRVYPDTLEPNGSIDPFHPVRDASGDLIAPAGLRTSSTSALVAGELQRR